MEFMRRMKRPAAGLALALAAFPVSMLLILNFPQPFFSYRVGNENLELYSDRPFSLSAGRQVLALAEAKLRRSPLFSAQQRHRIFVCNSRWRRSVYFAFGSQAGGLNYYPWTTNVFLSGAQIENNKLIKPSGKEDRLGRTLDHFIAHEIAHTLTGHAIGFLRYRKLPDWLKEGYAEYVGQGLNPDYAAATRLFMANAPEMNWPPIAPYRRYDLLVTYQLEKKKTPLRALLFSSASQVQSEQELRQALLP